MYARTAKRAIAIEARGVCHETVRTYRENRHDRERPIPRAASHLRTSRRGPKFFVTRALVDEKSVEEAGRALLAHFGCSAVVITRGEKGLSVIEESSPGQLHIPATSSEVTYARVGQPGVERGATGRQVFDVTGAGDTVLSLLALAVAAGAALRDAATLANAAAGVVVSKLGTASVAPAELSAALDEGH